MTHCQLDFVPLIQSFEPCDPANFLPDILSTYPVHNHSDHCGYKDTMENNAKALAKFKVNNIHSHPLMDRADRVILEGDHVNQA